MRYHLQIRSCSRGQCPISAIRITNLSDYPDMETNKSEPGSVFEILLQMSKTCAELAPRKSCSFIVSSSVAPRQAGAKKSGSKLPHSKIEPPRRFRVLFPRRSVPSRHIRADRARMRNSFSRPFRSRWRNGFEAIFFCFR